jgi:hypothetical protein
VRAHLLRPIDDCDFRRPGHRLHQLYEDHVQQPEQASSHARESGWHVDRHHHVTRSGESHHLRPDPVALSVYRDGSAGQPQSRRRAGRKQRRHNAYVGTEGTQTQFDGSGSNDPDNDALTYSWLFGDGTTGTGAKPMHTYADNGTYNATLMVSDGKGGTDTQSVTVTIANVAPTATPQLPSSNTTEGSGPWFATAS